MMVVFACNAAIAGSDLTVTTGSKKFLKSLNGTALLEFVWDNRLMRIRNPWPSILLI